MSFITFIRALLQVKSENNKTEKQVSSVEETVVLCEQDKDAISTAVSLIQEKLNLPLPSKENIALIINNAKAQGLTNKQIAYVLATVYHETAFTFEPLEEYGCGKNKPYGCWIKNSKGVNYCFKNGSRKDVYTQKEYNQLYYGRGFIQLTWFDNYYRAGKELYNVKVLKSADELLVNPNKAKDETIAALILVIGMRDGWFTGKKLSNYINESVSDFYNARRIVNGIDKADKIETYANNILEYCYDI